MTLALYGKSRRRQGALLTAALLAVIIATVGALGAITSAFAHHNEYGTTATCSEWTATASYVGGGSKVLVVMDNVVIGGQSYQGSWSSGFATGTGTSGGVLQYSGGQIDGRTLPNSGTGAITNLTNVWYWYGVDNSATIFNRNGGWPAGAFSGRILLYYQGGNNTWSFSLADSITPNDNDRGTITAPTQPSNCDRTIRVHKVVQGSGAPAQTFSYEIRQGSTVVHSDAVPNSSSPSYDNKTVTKQIGYTVVETAPLTGQWSFVKYARKQGLDDNCTGSGWSDQGTNQAAGVPIPADDNNYTVCIYNQYNAQVTKTCADLGLTLIDKFNWQGNPGSYVWESDGSQQVTITNGTATGGSWTSTVPIGAVIIKASTDFKVIPNPAPYPPDTLTGTFNNSGMTTPSGQTPAISNVQFCSGTSTPKGTLIVGKVKDPTAGVPAADGSQFSGTATNQGNAAVHNWGAITFGGFSTINNIPAGTYTLNETGTQNGWTPYGWAAGSLNQQGQPTCPSEKTSYTAGNPLTNVQVNANETKVVCVMNTKTAQQPTIDKQKASEGYTGGYAYWEIIVNNPENIAQTVQINDVDVTFVSVTGGTCSDSDFSDNYVTCSVNANSTLKVKVKKQIVTTCREQTVRNTATVYLVPPTGGQPVLIGTAGNSDDTEYTIPADTSKCGLPTITKEASQTSQTSDPSAVAWNVTVNNPNGTNGIQRTVWIKDANVTVTSGPTYSGGASCTGTFATELTDSDGVQCTMPAGSSITFTVKPNPAPQRTCQDQVFTNTASLYMSSGELVALIGEASSTITLLGNPELCTREVKVCKVLENNNDGITRSGMTFNFDIRPQNSSTIQVAINNVTEGGQPDNCKVVQVPANKSFDVAEWMSRPTGWNGDAARYPKYSINSGSQVSNNTTTMISAGTDPVTVVFYNKEKVVKNVTFSKYICNTFGDVPRNQGPGGQDDTGKPAYSAGGLNSLLGAKGPSNDSAPVDPSNDNRGSSCKLATTPWTFNLWTNARSNGSGGSLLQTFAVTGSQSVLLNQAVIDELVAGRNVYVEEVYQTGYAFGALKCYTDHLNDDNWEWLYPSILPEQGTVHCIAYNVPVKTITIQKVWVGDSEITKDDYPIFTLEGFPFDKACTGPQLSSPSGTPPVVTGTWTCTVPVGWNGKVTEVPATGWKQCDMPNGNGNGTFSAQTEAYGFTNCKLGKIIVHKVYPQGTPTDSATFSGTISNNSNTYNWGPLMVNGSYTIENVVPGPYDVSETLPSGYELVGIYSATSSTNPGAAIACGAQTSLVADVPDSPDIMVNPGETLHVWVCNRPLGTVVIVKYENVPPATAQTWTFTGNSPILSQSLSTTGTTNSVGTASTTILNVPAGSYTVAETQGRGRCETGTTSSDWETRGLVQVGGSLPTAGDVNSADIIGSGSLNVPVKAGTTTYVVFGNIGCGSVLSAANLQVNKFSDPLANFTGTTPLGGWTITITGTAGTAAGFTATQQTNGAGQAFFLGIPDGTYTVCETLQSGWANVGSKYNTVTQAGLCRTGVTVNLNQTATVDFYNQPRVTIRVHKTLNVVGFTSNGQGWQFTLTGCGITPQTKTTDANGIADFTDLPPAISCVYTVTETVQPGWTPQFVSQTAQPVAGGQVVRLEFLNIKDFNPPCTDPNDPRCVPPPPPSTPTPTPTGTPPTPTVTTTPPPTATPTNTPTPTPTNTPVTQVAGERTPGPGASPTPLAPSTGYGFGSAQGGMSLLLVLAGLISLSLGLGFIALGRRTNR